MEGNFVTILLPIPVLSVSIGNSVVSCFLAVFAQSSHAVDDGKIITVNGDTVFMVCVCCHAASHRRCLRCQYQSLAPVAVTRGPTDTFYAAHLDGPPCATQLPGIRQTTLSLYRYVRAPRVKSPMFHEGSMGSRKTNPRPPEQELSGLIRLPCSSLANWDILPA